MFECIFANISIAKQFENTRTTKYEAENGNIYILPEGQNPKKKRAFGEICLPSGAHFLGNMKNFEPHGFGVMTYNCGSTFKGNFKKNAFHGVGKWTRIEGGVYEGYFKHNLKHGLGRYSGSDGMYYEGKNFSGYLTFF